jgi:hypothetical protein
MAEHRMALDGSVRLEVGFRSRADCKMIRFLSDVAQVHHQCVVGRTRVVANADWLFNKWQ